MVSQLTSITHAEVRLTALWVSRRQIAPSASEPAELIST